MSAERDAVEESIARRGAGATTSALLDALCRSERDAEREVWRERDYQRRCVSCRFARVTEAHPDDHPLQARTYCGNEESPAYDREVSFFGNSTCGEWAKGRPEHNEGHLPKARP